MKKNDKVEILRTLEVGVVESTAEFGPAKVVTVNVNGNVKTFTEEEVRLIETTVPQSVVYLGDGKLSVKIVNKSNYSNPEYKHEGDAGMDLKANIDEPIVLNSLERTLIPTGIHIQLPDGYEAQIRPRSGLAAKHGITVINSPGTVDANYTGEVCVPLVNLSAEPFTIEPGERVAQMVVARHETVNWVNVDSLDATERGDGGFGSTGRK